MSQADENKKVLVLLGSPRKKGNSRQIAAWIAEGAESSGATVETIFLNSLNIKPCQACEGCRKPEADGCVVDDDMIPLYAKIKEAHAVVFASPVYFFTMSAQLKAVLDRCFAFGANEYRDVIGKRMAVAMSYGDADPFRSGCVNALRTFQDAFAYLDCPLVGMVYGSANQAGEIAANEKLMAEARELGKKLLA